MNKPKLGTFSILTISPDSRLMGLGVASGSTFVGNRVLHAKPGIGVIATQSYTNVTYGIKGLELLAKGLSPKEALDELLMADLGRELRQVAMMDFKRRKAVFTGCEAPAFHGEVLGEDYVVVGNLLAGKEVVDSMAREYGSSSGNLALRMAKALKAGSESGGDKRGEKSAALIVISTEKVEVNLKIDRHANPVGELFRKLS
ncbi:DUF1028 domain-containing protein [Candidatus Bathyarchaeota archaeon]|nr:DUF1028 domain-containing protein [Candidatus Bathyarchaeota archaeon]